MARTTRRLGSGIIFLPISTTYPSWKIEIGGEDISSFVESADVVLIATERLSYVQMKLDNNKGRFNDKWEPETNSIDIDVYFDYAQANDFTTHTPTNKIFHGKLDYAIPGLTGRGWVMEARGRDRPELFDTRMTIDFNSENISDAIKATIDKLNLIVGYTVISYTDNSIGSTGEITSTNYRSMRTINILSDLCKKANFDSRIDPDGLYNAFTKGSQINLREAIVSGINLLLCPPMGKKPTRISNNIIVYGPEIEGCLTLWNRKSDSFQPWRKDLVINDTSLLNQDQVVDRAEKEYNILSNTEVNGSPICIGQPFLKPGEAIKTFISYVYTGMPVASQVSHMISARGVETKTTINELERDGLRLIKENEKEISEKQTFNNPNDMTHSHHFTFDNDDDISTHSNTETSNGKLRSITEIADAGVTLTKSFDSPSNVSQIELRHNANDDLDITSFKVSVDESNFEVIVPGTKGNPGTPINIANTGKKISVSLFLFIFKTDN